MTQHNIDKPEIEELLSHYIDGELSEREQTEVRRMAANDERFAERLIRMQKQKELLENLPVESAPDGITDVVRGALERKFLLNQTPAAADGVAGARNLFARHAMTAAIIFVLFGGLLYLVMQVFRPPADMPNVAIKLSPAIETIALRKRSPIKPMLSRYDSKVPEFSASLEVTSSDAITMNAFIKKVIFNKGLDDDTFKNSNDGVTNYYITADIKKIRALVADMSDVWANSQGKTFTAHGIFPGTDVVVKNVTAAQVVAVFRQDEFLDRIEVARDFSDFNAVVGNSERAELYAANDETGRMKELLPVKPELTSSYLPMMGYPEEKDVEKASLTITVKGI